MKSTTSLSSFEQLSRVCAAFFERPDRPALTSLILDAAIEWTQGDTGTVFLIVENEPARFIATGVGGREAYVNLSEGIAGRVFRSSVPILANDVQDEEDGYAIRSRILVPLRTPGGRTLGVIEVFNSRKGRFGEEELQLLQLIAMFAAIALDNRLTLDTLSDSNEALRCGHRSWVQDVETFGLVSSNQQLQELYDKLPAFAQSDGSVLIEGENGTGKKTIAQAMHAKSRRHEKPFITINCAAIPEGLFEAELFGTSRKGKVELAHGGTLFLDEIGELPASIQTRLFKVLQEGAVARAGSEDRSHPVDFRLIAATRRNLAQHVRDGKFREDLFHRINTVHFRLFPLRERRQDLPGLCRSILTRFTAERGWTLKSVSDAALARLMECPWTGNLRELQNQLEGAVIRSGERSLLEPQDFTLDFMTGAHAPRAVAPLAQVITLDLRRAKENVEKQMIDRALAQTRGNKSQAARLLGITREGLRKAMKKVA